MRKLKVQMHISVDGFVAGPEGQLDWIGSFGADKALEDLVNALIDSSDTMVLGRETAHQIVNYWENVAENQPDSPEYTVARKLVDMQKVAFSKQEIKGKNLRVEKGGLVPAVQAIKNEPGKDIIVYGGAQFVSSLIDNNLVDEYYFFVNPVSLGKGLAIFNSRKALKLVKSTAFTNGMVLHHYSNG